MCACACVCVVCTYMCVVCVCVRVRVCMCMYVCIYTIAPTIVLYLLPICEDALHSYVVAVSCSE